MFCSKLGIAKINTTACHPERNGMVKRFNRIPSRPCSTSTTTSLGHSEISTYLVFRGRAGEHWWEAIILVFGVDCRIPSENALLLPSSLDPIDVNDYTKNWHYHCHQLEPLLLHRSKRHSLSTRSAMTGKLNVVHLRLVSEYIRTCEVSTWGNGENEKTFKTMAWTILSSIMSRPWYNCL